MAQHSIAREWNEVLLEAIRGDLARPTVHARNLFHSAILMYDSWAVFDPQGETIFLGKSFGGYACTFEGITDPTNTEAARQEMISYAMYRFLNHRFADSPRAVETQQLIDDLFDTLGYDSSMTSTDYGTGSYAALGNYLTEQLILFGLQDGSNEQNGYGNQFYNPQNEPLLLDMYEDTNDLADPNRWQPLAFETFVDQSGNPFPGSIPEFLNPEWGEVAPFALTPAELQKLNNGFESYVYNDPGPPPLIANSDVDGFTDPYKWNFALVASWSAHLDPADPTMIDISPASLGNVNIDSYPQTFQEYQAFYNFTDGGDPGTGHAVNPVTQMPYTPQMVLRADYARVLAEFWADGPDSETPPGHWFTILNYVNDHPLIVKRVGGVGAVLSDFEWDVKAYLALGGAMHDAAITTWGIKGYYDYIRPVSAIRYMAGKGQSSDAGLPSYDPHGLPLISGSIELITSGDPLSGTGGENVGKVKIRAWRGPDFVNDPSTDVAGVGWILGTRWWPYQRPTFVTPPFAGYVSGHSTFSRAAAEVLTLLTGDAFFPGGMGTFDVEQNSYLVFEQGPSESFTLQWATYQDASDQTSLSRIWGGIHPPVDDIPGRRLGEKIGTAAFALASEYYNGEVLIEADNFLIQVLGETCDNMNNGSLNIGATDYFEYVASLNGTTYPFTKTLSISDLSPGNYSLCITVASNDNFERCFEFTIQEALMIDAIATVSTSGIAQIVNISVSKGTPPYKLKINNKEVQEFSTEAIKISALEGDKIEVGTAHSCEGSFTMVAEQGSATSIFPNPAGLETNIMIAEDLDQIRIDLFSLEGKLIESGMHEVNNGQIILPLINCPSGLFLAKVYGKTPKTFKLIKQ
jgi:hypothetical protein